MTTTKWLGWIFLSALGGAAALAGRTAPVTLSETRSSAHPASRSGQEPGLVADPDAPGRAHLPGPRDPVDPHVTGFPATSMAAWEAQRGRRGNVEVVDLRVNGRYDEPLGLDDPSPILAWRMRATPSASHPCHWSGPEVACPADEQTAYRIQAAKSTRDLNRENLIWDSGKVTSRAQSGVMYAGNALRSRERVVWRVRVWDADGAPSAWSSPARWEMGLLQQSDWGSARWIEYPGRTESQPLPIFARQFNLCGDVATARLYLSGIGLHFATVNGQNHRSGSHRAGADPGRA